MLGMTTAETQEPIPPPLNIKFRGPGQGEKKTGSGCTFTRGYGKCGVNSHQDWINLFYRSGTELLEPPRGCQKSLHTLRNPPT